MASRLEDMFQFYRTDRDYTLKDGRTLAIDPAYWNEKLVCGRDDTRKFSLARLKKIALEYIDSRLDGEDWTEDEIQDLKNEVIQEINYTDENSVRMFDMMNEYEYHKDETSYLDEPDFEFTDWWEHADSCSDYTFHYIWRCYAVAYAVQEYYKFKGEVK